MRAAIVRMAELGPDRLRLAGLAALGLGVFLVALAVR